MLSVAAVSSAPVSQRILPYGYKGAVVLRGSRIRQANRPVAEKIT
ncbi:MAG TPA: hypothetical protein VLI05_06710 [Candidatus Saccharimonadia bacterium]|nr:hypothetical protein [Candidatus Saccharimonadia bacterium]